MKCWIAPGGGDYSVVHSSYQDSGLFSFPVSQRTCRVNCLGL